MANTASVASERPAVQRFLFEESNNLHNEIISLHDFVLPMSTAMWHFRQIIEDELTAVPSPTPAELAQKHNKAPSTRGSTNLVTPFHSISWDDQRQRIAEIALVNVIAIFEVWCEEICSKLGRDDLAIKLQFPTNSTRTRGVGSAIDDLTAIQSIPMTVSIYPALIIAKKYSILNLDNLLKCYRYFKELRNNFMHRGRRCDGKLYGAQSDFVPIANASALGMSFVPEHSLFHLGEQISLSLHGVLGFTDVILRIVTTIDAELSRSIPAEIEVIRRIKAVKQTPIKRTDSIRSIFNTFGIQGITLQQEFVDLLRHASVLR